MTSTPAKLQHLHSKFRSMAKQTVCARSVSIACLLVPNAKDSFETVKTHSHAGQTVFVQDDVLQPGAWTKLLQTSDK